MTEITPVLEFERVRISFMLAAGEINVIPGLSFRIGSGEALGLVGESGSGKSTVAFACVKYLGRHGRVMAGRILFEGRDIAALDEAELTTIRGHRIAMVYQDPMSSLNPMMTIGRQLMEVPMLHHGADARAARERAVAMLAEVNFADPAGMLDRYPHQLSGGQQQRVVIAMALIGEPALLIMDEPTTGLDVTVEAAVLDLVKKLVARRGTALLFISHNLATVAQLCDRIAVLYGGELIEEGPIGDVFGRPRHPYTRGLIDSIPHLGQGKRERPLRPIAGQAISPTTRPPGCGFAPRCAYAEPRCRRDAIALAPVGEPGGHQVACVRLSEITLDSPAAATDATTGAEHAAAVLLWAAAASKAYRRQARGFAGRAQTVKALTQVDLAARRGETLAIVGESGCGKSTLARIMSGLETVTSGEIVLDGTEIGRVAIDARPAALKRQLQMVFQNPDSTLNPSHRAGYAIARALRRLRRLPREAARIEVERLLDAVKLAPELAERMPHQLSGGQKQRVAIARALAGEPEVIVADEPVSALDVSVQAAIINLLAELQAERGTTLVFISHDLAVVRYLADHVAVMYLGRVVEFGPVDAIFAPPYHPYTEALLSAVPTLERDAGHHRIILEGTLPSSTDLPPGCPFASRCPRKLGAICETTPPPLRLGESGHRILCHIPLAELARAATPSNLGSG